MLLVAWNGAAYPVACFKNGRLEPGLQCKVMLRGSQRLRASSGTLTTEAWDPTGAMCPWSGGTPEDAALQLGSLQLHRSEWPPEPLLTLWPANSSARLATVRALDQAISPRELRLLAGLVGADPNAVRPGEAFALDLNGDGRTDRVVQLRQPMKGHPFSERAWTFILVDGAPPRTLARAGCMEQFVGAVDLDGDGQMELVMLFQYQAMLFRLDGSIAVENGECCGLG